MRRKFIQTLHCAYGIHTPSAEKSLKRHPNKLVVTTVAADTPSKGRKRSFFFSNLAIMNDAHGPRAADAWETDSEQSRERERLHFE